MLSAMNILHVNEIVVFFVQSNGTMVKAMDWRCRRFKYRPIYHYVTTLGELFTCLFLAPLSLDHYGAIKCMKCAVSLVLCEHVCRSICIQ